MKNDKIKIVALFGKSASGKNYLQSWIIKNYPTITHKIIRETTRPKRENEIDKEDYNFISAKLFAEDLLRGELIEAENFNDWFYGTRLSSLSKRKVNVGCYSISAIELLEDDDRFEILPIYIRSPDKIRLLRSITRDSNVDCTEICRRFLADNDDFSKIDKGFSSTFSALVYDNIEGDEIYLGCIPDFKDFLNIS